MASTLEVATKLAEVGGLSVLPIRADGSKAPAVTSWEPLQKDIPGPDELKQMFSNGAGIGIVCGRVSGNLEVIDFDIEVFYERFSQVIEAAGRQELLNRLPVVKTPRGKHVYLRCDSGISGNQKLAQILDEQQHIKTVIETRGEGGYVITIGSPAACHPARKTYQLTRGDLLKIPNITAEDREFLLTTARSLNRYVRKEPERTAKEQPAVQDNGGRPGDDFNQRATWAEILGAKGWKHVSTKGDEEHWRRPGKDEGISATVNYKGSGLLYVFSTNTEFESGRGYSKFSAYALLNHNGNHSEASRALRSKGFGAEPAKTFPNLAARVRDYLDGIEGVFHTRQLCADLGITDPKDKANVRQILNRYKGSQIQIHGDLAGSWRVIRGQLEAMDLLNAKGEDLDITFPLDLHNYATIMPGNIIVVTGDPDAGKTAFLLSTIYQNLKKWDCHYFNSEMGAFELRKRLELFKDFPISHPHFHAYERSDSFEDVIRPGKYNLNVIDYLEVTEEFYLISKHLAAIYKALQDSVAIVAIQKRSRTSDMPLGAQRALEKPRLAIALSAGNRSTPNRATILKCKNRKVDHSMIGRSRPFKLVSGCQFISDSPEWT
jgi:hypothetical protein